jgi:hypothetical protein
VIKWQNRTDVVNEIGLCNKNPEQSIKQQMVPEIEHFDNTDSQDYLKKRGESKSQMARNNYIIQNEKTMMIKILMKQILLLCFFFFLSISSLKAQLKAVKGENGKLGLMDGSGKMIGPFIYSLIGSHYADQMNEPVLLKDQFREGLVRVYILKSGQKKGGYIDTTGKVVIPLIYDECEPFGNGVALVFLGEKCGLIDKTGKILIPIKYAGGLFRLTNNLWTASDGVGKHGITTQSGIEVLPIIYNMMVSYPDYGIITLNKKKGYFNMDGKLTIPCIYDDAKRFEDGIAAVALNNKWGYIDVAGKTVLPFEYEYPALRTGEEKRIKKIGGKYEPFVMPRVTPPLTAKELLSYHINHLGGQLSIAAIKNCRFTVEEFNSKNILYTTSVINQSGANIHANVYDNNSKQTTERIMTGGGMWLKENNKVSKEEYETDNLFLYSLPSLLVNAEKLGYQLVYDPKKSEERGSLYITVRGKEALRTEYVFTFNNDYSINKIEVSRGDWGYTLANFKYTSVQGLTVLSEWSSSRFGNESLVWTKRKDFQVNVKMDDKLFLKPL